MMEGDVEGDPQMDLDFNEGNALGSADNTTWDSLPIFATPAHHSLFAQIQVEKSRVAQLSEAVQENEERIAIMGEHLKNVQQELQHTQALCDSKIRETQTEDHIKQLAEREASKVVSDYKQTEKDLQMMQDKLSSLQSETYYANEKLEQFKQQMNYNQEALEQWALAARQKDEDSLALAKYMRADEERTKALNLHIEKLTKELAQSKQNLENEVTETQTAQIELDRTAEDFKKLHLERQALIKQWDEAVKAMARRDQAITQLAEKITVARRDVNQLETAVSQQKEYLEREKANNAELEVQLNADERKLEKVRMSLQSNQTDLDNLDEAVELQRGELQKVSSDLNASKNNVHNLQQSKVEKEAKQQEYADKLTSTRLKLERETEKAQSLEERHQQVHTYHKEHENALKAVEKELEQTKESMFKFSQELFKQRKDEASLVADISGTQSTARNLQAKIHDLDQRSLKQQEMLYNIEFQVQQLERKVSRASGKRSQEETLILNKRIAELQAELETAAQERDMLNTQVKRLTEDIRVTKRTLIAAEKEQIELEGKIQEEQLETESAAQQLRYVTKLKEEAVVSHASMQLEVKRLRDLLHQKADQVIGLENRKMMFACFQDVFSKPKPRVRPDRRRRRRLSHHHHHHLHLKLPPPPPEMKKIPYLLQQTTMADEIETTLLDLLACAREVGQSMESIERRMIKVERDVRVTTDMVGIDSDDDDDD